MARSRRDRDWPYTEAVRAVRNVLGVPILARGQPLGAVLLFNKRPSPTSPGREFVEEDLQLIAALRYQAAALLENARRYKYEHAMFDGFAHPGWPAKIAQADREMLEELMEMRRAAHERALGFVEKVRAARAAMHLELYEELVSGLKGLAATIALCRDWHGYLLMQYGIERGLYPPDRPHLARMSRYVERFIRSLADLRDTPAGKRALAHLAFPDPFF